MTLHEAVVALHQPDARRDRLDLLRAARAGRRAAADSPRRGRAPSGRGGRRRPSAVEEEVLLGREVVVDGVHGDVGRLGDLRDGHRHEAVLQEQPGGDVRDPLPRLALLALPEPLCHGLILGRSLSFLDSEILVPLQNLSDSVFLWCMPIISTAGSPGPSTTERGPVEAVRGIDLTVRAGEILGFLGPNGAGQDDHPPDAHDPAPAHRRRRHRRGPRPRRRPGRRPPPHRIRRPVRRRRPPDPVREELVTQGRLYRHDAGPGARPAPRSWPTTWT